MEQLLVILVAGVQYRELHTLKLVTLTDWKYRLRDTAFGTVTFFTLQLGTVFLLGWSLPS